MNKIFIRIAYIVKHLLPIQRFITIQNAQLQTTIFIIFSWEFFEWKIFCLILASISMYSFYIGEDSPEHSINASIQYCFTQLTQPCDIGLNMQLNQHWERPHPEKLPKQLVHLVESSVLFIMQSKVHWAFPQQLKPHSFRAFVTSFLLVFQLTLSSSLHWPSTWILLGSPELKK